MSSDFLALQTATPESVRQVNRSILLGLARRLAPVSRAELARRSGLFRSSVSRIIEEMVEEGLLTEERSKPSGRGKVPLLLRVRDEYFHVLGVYIQPMLTTVAFAGFTGEIREISTFPTPKDPDELVRQVAARARTQAAEIRSIGVGVPGWVAAAEGRITSIPMLASYGGFPLAEELSKATGVPVEVDNDCNLGAMAELRRMELAEDPKRQNFLFVSIGDYGVGAGLILNGELYRGHDARFAAEVGHMIVEPGGLRCSCGRRGCFEMYAANHATWRRYRPRRAYTQEGFRKMLADAVAGESDARAAVEETARYFALVASNAGALLNPAEIVVAGEITAAYPLISEAVDRLYRSRHAKVTLRRSGSPREAPLLHGAVHLALNSAAPPPSFGPLQSNSNAVARS